MLDIRYIRENPQLVQKGTKDKGFEVDIKKMLVLDKKVRDLELTVQKLREEKNKIALEKDIERGKKLKEKLGAQERKLQELNPELNKLLYKIPNLPKPDVPIGKDETQNKVIKKYKTPGKLDFKPLDHLEIGENLDIIDVKIAAKVSGTRFGYLKNQAALLEFALVQFAFEVITKEGFIPVVPPVLIKKEIMQGLGYLEQGIDDMFKVQDDLFLVGTAEHTIVPMHKDELLNVKELPKRYVGFSTSFRGEAGSYGKDTRGIFRVHQFDKVEMVSFTTEENDDKEHEYLLSLQEKLFQLLEIPYRVVKMCTGDLGFPTARKYDLEAWMPSQKKYREVTSCSTTTDFQARRLNIKYQDGNEKKFVHILNGTAFAIGRTIIAILENYQQKDGSILIPKVLQKYLDFSKISS